MAEFKKLRDGMFAAGQIEPGDVAQAKEAGVTLIINNRPDDESEGQPKGSEIEAEAKAHGIAYKAIPVSSAGFSLPQVDEMQSALASTEGKVLAFCRSGTRSTILWALSQAKNGGDPDELSSDAAAAGYDLAGVRPTIDLLRQQHGS